MGATILPTYVAEVKSEIRSPRLVGKSAAIEASATVVADVNVFKATWM